MEWHFRQGRSEVPKASAGRFCRGGAYPFGGGVNGSPTGSSLIFARGERGLTDDHETAIFNLSAEPLCQSSTTSACGNQRLVRGRPIVPGLATSKDARIKRSANNDRGAGSDTFGQEIVERSLFQQGIASGQQESVPGPPFQRFQQHLALVDADADRRHLAAAAQRFEARQPSRARFSSTLHSLRRRAGRRRYRAHRECRSAPCQDAESCPRTSA